MSEHDRDDRDDRDYRDDRDAETTSRRPATEGGAGVGMDGSLHSEHGESGTGPGADTGSGVGVGTDGSLPEHATDDDRDTRR